MEQSIILAGLVALWLLYHLLKMMYQLSPLHPLSSIPGPKLAAASYFPEFWQDVVRFGRYTHQIRKMHEQYGMPSTPASSEPALCREHMCIPSLEVLMTD